jgi:hypothetical protein
MPGDAPSEARAVAREPSLRARETPQWSSEGDWSGGATSGGSDVLDTAKGRTVSGPNPGFCGEVERGGVSAAGT